MTTPFAAKRSWAGILLVVVIAQSIALPADETGQAFGQTPSVPGVPTEAELKAIYDAVSPEDQKLIDTWTPEQKHQYLISKWSAVKMLEGNGATHAAQETPIQRPGRVPYDLDPVLREAYSAYVDEKRPSSDAIELFKKYLAANPNSEFLPEIYFRLGASYSIHRREGDPRNVSLQVEYYTKAHELYGRKYDHVHRTAWATLANRSRSLKVSREYYDWLLELQAEGAVEDIYPVRTIGQTRNGRWPQKPADALQVALENMRRTLPSVIEVAESNMLYIVSRNYAQLAELAAAYPNRSLGKIARQRLDRLDRESSNGAIRRMDDPGFMDPVTADAQENVVAASGTQAQPLAETHVPPSNAAQANGWLVAGIVAVALVLLLCGSAFWMSRRRAYRGRAGSRRNTRTETSEGHRRGQRQTDIAQ